MSLQYHGRRAYRAAIAQDLHHAQLLAQAIEAHPELELLAPVSLSAVCFRHVAKDNAAILRRVIARGRVYLSNATINGQFALTSLLRKPSDQRGRCPGSCIRGSRRCG